MAKKSSNLPRTGNRSSPANSQQRFVGFLDRAREQIENVRGSSVIADHEKRAAIAAQMAAEAAKMRHQYLTSPTGQKALERQKSVMDQMARLQKEMGKGTGPGGKPPEGPEEKKRQLERDLQLAINSATSIFNAGWSQMKSLVSSSDFTTFDTLTGSFRLLSATIGAEFAPYIDMVSLKLQQLAKWFKGLDQGTKDWMAKMVVIGVGSMGVVAAIGKITVAVRGLGVAMTMLAAHPAIAALMAIGAIGGLVIGSTLMSDAPDRFQPSGLPSGHPGRRSTWDVTSGMYQTNQTVLSTLFRNQGMSDTGSEVLGTGVSLAMTGMQFVQSLFGYGPLSGTRTSQSPKEILKSLPEGIRDELKGAKSDDERRLIMARIIKDNQAEMERARKTGGPVSGHQHIINNLQALLGGADPNDLLRAINLPAKSRFLGSFSEYSDSLQTAALNTSDLEGEVLKTQIENTKRIAGLITKVEDMATSIRNLFP